ncbi:MAG: site-specific integrase [Oceanococcus sp.]|nr:MAG: site-specific integrase [Oceanococcus sp.]
MGRERRPSNYPGVELRPKSIRIDFYYHGKRCRESLSIPPTDKNLKFAASLLGKVKFEIAAGTFDYAATFPNSKHALSQKPAAGTTVADIARLWERTLTQAASTKKAYKKYLKNHVLPAFGERSISSVTQTELEIWRAELGSKLRPKSGNQVLIVIRKIFELAIGDGLIARDPAARLKNFKNPRKSVADPFSTADIAALLANADERDPQLANMLDLWWTSGLRPSELIALEWTDVDWHQRRLRIRQAFVDNEITDGKTLSERLIDLCDHAICALKRQRRLSPRQSALIFLGATGKPMKDCQMLSKRVHRLYGLAGVRMRKPYQFRHTFASMMLSAGEKPYYVARQLGQASLVMLERHYGQWMDGAQKWNSFSDAVEEVRSLLPDSWDHGGTKLARTGGGQGATMDKSPKEKRQKT